MRGKFRMLLGKLRGVNWMLIAAFIGGVALFGGVSLWQYGKSKEDAGVHKANMATVRELSNYQIEKSQEKAENKRDYQAKQQQKAIKHKDAFKGDDADKRAKAAFDLIGK